MELSNEGPPSENIAGKRIYPLELNNIILTIFEDPGARQLLMDIANGVSTWLFRVLADYRVDNLVAKKHCLSFGEKIMAHVKNSYDLNRQYSQVTKSFREYLDADNRTVLLGVKFVLSSFRTSFKNDYSDYSAALIALLISVRREEGEFEKFRAGSEKYTDLRQVLLAYHHTYNKDKMMNGPGGRVGSLVSSEGYPPDNGVNDRTVFKGFNP